MHFTVGQKKLLTHIKRKRFYINSFLTTECKSDASQQTFFFKLEKRTSSSHKPPIVHKPFPIQIK